MKIAPTSDVPNTLRRARMTEKFSAGRPRPDRVWRFIRPTSNPPVRPVSRAPPRMGIGSPRPVSPMRREWKSVKSRSETPVR